MSTKPLSANLFQACESKLEAARTALNNSQYSFDSACATCIQANVDKWKKSSVTKMRGVENLINALSLTKDGGDWKGVLIAQYVEDFKESIESVRSDLAEKTSFYDDSLQELESAKGRILAQVLSETSSPLGPSA